MGQIKDAIGGLAKSSMATGVIDFYRLITPQAEASLEAFVTEFSFMGAFCAGYMNNKTAKITSLSASVMCGLYDVMNSDNTLSSLVVLAVGETTLYGVGKLARYVKDGEVNVTPKQRKMQ